MCTFYSRYRRRSLRQKLEKLTEQAHADLYWLGRALGSFLSLCGIGLFIILSVWALVNFIEVNF